MIFFEPALPPNSAAAQILDLHPFVAPLGFILSVAKRIDRIFGRRLSEFDFFIPLQLIYIRAGTAGCSPLVYDQRIIAVRRFYAQLVKVFWLEQLPEKIICYAAAQTTGKTSTPSTTAPYFKAFFVRSSYFAASYSVLRWAIK